MTGVVVLTVTVETTIGVRVTTRTVDGWLSSVMTRGAFSSCVRVLSYKAWSTAVTVIGASIRLVPPVVPGPRKLDGWKPNAAFRLAWPVAEMDNPVLPKVDDQSTPV